MNIFVGNLNFQTTEKQLQTMFAKFGDVASVTIMTDRITKRARGFAFVEMADSVQAEKAIEQLNNITVDERSIVVNEAKPKNNELNGSRSNSRY